MGGDSQICCTVARNEKRNLGEGSRRKPIMGGKENLNGTTLIEVGGGLAPSGDLVEALELVGQTGEAQEADIMTFNTETMERSNGIRRGRGGSRKKQPSCLGNSG